MADFRIEIPVEKGWLAAETPVKGFPTDDSQQTVGRRLAWLRNRPAFASQLVGIHRAWEQSLVALGETDSALYATIVASLDEVFVQVDSLTAPTVEQWLAAIESPLADAGRQWLNACNDGIVSAVARAAGITVFDLDIQSTDDISLRAFRTFHSVWGRR